MWWVGIGTNNLSLDLFIVSNSANQVEIALMRMNKTCHAGAKWRARGDQNQLRFFSPCLILST